MYLKNITNTTNAGREYKCERVFVCVSVFVENG